MDLFSSLLGVFFSGETWERINLRQKLLEAELGMGGIFNVFWLSGDFSEKFCLQYPF